jgi:hypothetical protein
MNESASNPKPIGGRLRKLRQKGAPAVLDAVIVTVVVPDVLTVVLGTLQLTPGKVLGTVQEKETVPLKPRMAPTVMVAVVELPAVMVAVVMLEEI